MVKIFSVAFSNKLTNTILAVITEIVFSSGKHFLKEQVCCR